MSVLVLVFLLVILTDAFKLKETWEIVCALLPLWVCIGSCALGKRSGRESNLLYAASVNPGALIMSGVSSDSGLSYRGTLAPATADTVEADVMLMLVLS